MLETALILIAGAVFCGSWIAISLRRSNERARRMAEAQQARMQHYTRLEYPCRKCGGSTVYRDDDGPVHVDCREVA